MAPSRAPGGGRGLFSLALRLPNELVGAFDGDWHWAKEGGGRAADLPEGVRRPGTLRRFGLEFSVQDGDQEVSAVVAPCRGKAEPIAIAIVATIKFSAFAISAFAVIVVKPRSTADATSSRASSKDAWT